MAVTREDLGAVGSYGIAKKMGFTGTKEEWYRLQKEAPEWGARAEAAAQQAERDLALVNQKTTEAVQAINEEGERVKNSIPADYTALSQEVGRISQELNSKMEFYKVNLEGGVGSYHFTHTNDDGTKVNLNYADLKSKYQDDKYFLFCEWRSVTFIPSLPPDYDPTYGSEVIEFTATWDYMGEHRITCIKINSNNQIKADDYEDDFLIADKKYIDEVKTQLSESINDISDGVYNSNRIAISQSSYGWKLLDNGLCMSDSSYSVLKYAITEGKLYKVTGADKWQYQNVASVPSTGVPNRVGATYTSDGIVIAPKTATYIIASSSNDAVVSVAELDYKADGAIELITDTNDSIYSILEVCDFLKPTEIGRIFESSPNTAYNASNFVPTYYKILQGKFLTKFYYNAISTGEVSLYLYDVETMNETVKFGDSKRLIAKFNVNQTGVGVYTFESPLYIPKNKTIAIHGSGVLGYRGYTRDDQTGWMISSGSSMYSNLFTLYLGFDYYTLSELASIFNSSFSVVSYVAPYQTIVNLNTKKITIPKQYVFNALENFGEVQATELDFSNCQYYCWIYFNTETKTYSVKTNFSFNKNEVLMLLFPITHKEVIHVNNVLPYKIVEGYIGFIGDSITQGDGGTPYCAEVAEKLGMDFYNYGHSGCSFTLSSGNTFKDYVSTYADNLDVITIWGGVNDILWFNNFNIFEQEFESFIQTMLTNYPRAKFMIITPQKFYLTKSKFAGVKTGQWDEASSGDGKLLSDYVAIEKKVAEKYQIPVLDMFTVGVPCVNTTQRNNYYNGNGDWLHPNATGYKYVANRMAKAIEQL